MARYLDIILAEIEPVTRAIDEGRLAAFARDLLAAPRVFATGEGRSGLMARAFAMRLMHLGLTVYVVGETTTPALAGGDALVAVSGSGTTAGTLLVARQARDLGAAVFAVTTDPAAPLAALAAHTLAIPAATKWRRAGEAASRQPLGSLFDQCSHLALDAVCLAIAEARGLSNEAARRRHSNVE
ncbi:MAG TPA: 6-phospho-3-hexuloisomerase [Thermomicrobiales bacterium]|nr:6-phospho-3-hexuloisomerase [Thermomicrobiales bacterium]